MRKFSSERIWKIESGRLAQRVLNLIANSQNTRTGGWKTRDRTFVQGVFRRRLRWNGYVAFAATASRKNRY